MPSGRFACAFGPLSATSRGSKTNGSRRLLGTLFENRRDFQTAQGVNNSLRSLYWLAAQNRISTRRASVLAYIGSLILRTLPQIDADNAAGIKDPIAKPIPNPNPAL